MEQATRLTRRSFIGGAAVLAAGAAAGLAGCAPGGQQSGGGGEAQAEGSENWDEEFDVVVCGAGLAGLAAAITVATEGNGASCLLLEKGAVPERQQPVLRGAACSTATTPTSSRCIWTR